MREARVVVIGSGPCGAIAAWQLVQRGIPVTMLEAGVETPRGLLVRALGRNVYRKKPEGHFGSDCGAHNASGDPKTKWYYLLNPGGLSNHWTGAVPRFAPGDFTDGERLDPKYAWPLRYHDLVPYYERVERVMDVVGSATDVPNLPGGYAADIRPLPDDWQQVAAEFAKHEQGVTTLPVADGPRHMFTRRGTAFNSFSNIVQPLLRSPLFSLKCGAHAKWIEWSPSNRAASAVVYHDSTDGLEHRIDAAAFVVAAGALQSTRLLFDSVSNDFPRGIGNTNGLLGKYLHDHPREWWELETGKPMSRVSPSLYVTRRSYEQSPPLMAASWTLGASSTKEKLLGFTPLKTRRYGVQVFGTMIPTEEHRVAPVAGQKDELGLSRLDIKIHFEKAAIDNLHGAQERLLELLDYAGVPSKILPVPPDQVAPGTAVHYGGTARMHDSPAYGVVDSFNRVHDVQNVLVCDAACFTTGVEKNPTLTAMALASRATDKLATDLRAG